METKHTPGPWHIVSEPESIAICCWPEDTGESVLAELPASEEAETAYGAPYHCNQAEANARLMAAAPMLLDALTDLVGGCGKEGDLYSSAAMDKALKAIAKAKGN